MKHVENIFILALGSYLMISGHVSLGMFVLSLHPLVFFPTIILVIGMLGTFFRKDIKALIEKFFK